ncbi:Mitochondrial import inner membrane translocase subunit Tim17 family protein [Histomonas meleagridis]|uniref:Mitochondrial import inner membrane translocase subunit Tim17 family protein n=1 Tax=Histomonas meleagridis TaxID=135588 RepID=UPI00355A19B9|nr:Mitochondrial import inner membrane translocase subunit Tim17 family protein [Histomonas meleagridis]KAH0797885.1 Mitochondrial import inner membrane translocase subunit Tim17 family protein [Histomonas meleagridis]
MEKLATSAGKSFIYGYGTGFAAGSVASLALNIDELPLVRLNQTLNNGVKYGEILGYKAAMTTTLFMTTKSLVNKKINNPIITNAIGGAASGAFLGSHWGYKGAIGGGIAGSLVGALYGYGIKANEKSQETFN